ncbi:MAG: DNA mismatch repair protein MutS [Planctomycetales bacterium]|nr:DNA mismatch repair protein MutS [Planctomycetales bacterium]
MATPMMQQYMDAKQACGDALLLFRMGDFYELFYEDAKTAARTLGLTLTSRDKGENPIPMAGFPYHQLEGYLGKLIAAGFRAAVCEQVEDPKKAVGLVKREVTRLVTPGTVTDDALLDPRESNFLAAVITSSSKDKGKGEVGLAWAELSTGRFHAAVFPASRLADELARIGPAEVLLSEDAPDLPPLSGHPMITRRPPWSFALDSATKSLAKHFCTANLDGFGFVETDGPALRAAGAVLDYLQETQKASLDHIDRLTPYRPGELLEIDEATRRSLELTRTIRSNSREGSLLAVIDRTVTPLGARLLAEWVAAPLTNIPAITARQESVEELATDSTLRSHLRDYLKEIYDLERLLARVITLRASPRDLSCISRTLASLPKLKAKLTERRSSLLKDLEQRLDLCPEIRASLESALVEDCPLLATGGGIIRDGYNGDLDRLRDLAAGGKQWIARYQAQESERTGIPNLKVAYNKVFGYYIEITNAHKDKTPADYIRKQTTVNTERYVTPQLKQYEEQVLTADERAKELEHELFLKLRESVQREAKRLQGTAAALAQLDVLAALAELAKERGYVRPIIVEDPILRIIDGRHPVLDILEPQGTFVPNDCVAGGDEGTILLITGPNMAGKSTYIRQVALLTLLAQMGSFVPAKEATIGICDRIFARVGASDELTRGQSTFMVEMTETARILNTATPRSLVVLDEIGRGTSTYDGISLAWAIVEHLHDHLGSRTLFATHYHELTDLSQSLRGVANLNVAVKEWEDHVVFLHKIVPGAADKSYGIHVARLAGVPRSVNERAKQILAQLEAEHLNGDGKSKIAVHGKSKRKGDLQLTLFAPEEHPLIGKLRELDVNSLTPYAALQLLGEWQEEIGAAPRTAPK